MDTSAVLSPIGAGPGRVYKKRLQKLRLGVHALGGLAFVQKPFLSCDKGASRGKKTASWHGPVVR